MAEAITETPKVPKAPMSLEEYQYAIVARSLIDGIEPENVTHAFYIWVGLMTEYKDIGGTTLAELYNKNVLQNKMKESDFYNYCQQNKFPIPLQRGNIPTQHGADSNTFFARDVERRRASYETWAQENGISIGSQKTMLFTDAQGNTKEVAVDFEHLGEYIE